MALAILALILTVYPAQGFGPLNVRFTVWIDKDARNRSQCIGYTSEDGEERVSCWTIEGERAPRATQITWMRIAPGAYTAWAAVCYVDETACAKEPKNRRAVASKSLRVLGLEE